MTVRIAQAADIPAMHQIRLSVRENTLSDPNRISEADYHRALDELGRTWVSKDDGRIVAFATGYRNGSIWALFVDPEHEGHGHGKALLSTVVAWLWSLGHQRLWLDTTVGTRAERFYLAQGWQPCGLTASGEQRLELCAP